MRLPLPSLHPPPTFWPCLLQVRMEALGRIARLLCTPSVLQPRGLRVLSRAGIARLGSAQSVCVMDWVKDMGACQHKTGHLSCARSLSRALSLSRSRSRSLSVFSSPPPLDKSFAHVLSLYLYRNAQSCDVTPSNFSLADQTLSVLSHIQQHG